MTIATTRFALTLTLPALLLAGCTPAADEAGAPAAASEATGQDAFFEALSTHCGKAYAGKLASDDAADADFVEAEMVMHVSECSEDRIAVPFHVGIPGESGIEWDRSRTWLITRTETDGAAGLRLKHDHRHEDGTNDPVTMYGGDTAAGDDGTARAQEFPVDAESIALFEREDLGVSVTNVWRVEIDPAGTEGAQFNYQLKRSTETGAPEDRNFRVEFDLTSEIEAPPAAWGWE